MIRDLLGKRDAYRALFMDGEDANPNTVRVLADLQRFCHANATTAMVDRDGRMDPLAMAQIEGRRQVYMRIVQMCRASDEDINDAIRAVRAVQTDDF